VFQNKILATVTELNIEAVTGYKKLRKEELYGFLFTKYCNDEVKNRDCMTEHTKPGKRNMKEERQPLTHRRR
jgi:hypothetical protein